MKEQEQDGFDEHTTQDSNATHTEINTFGTRGWACGLVNISSGYEAGSP
jgi:hypothetical protein